MSVRYAVALLGLSLPVLVSCQKEQPAPGPAVAVAASADATTAAVTVNCASSFVVGQSSAFSGTASAGITKIIASVDGYIIKDMPVTNGTYSFSYAFSQAGTNRRLNVNAFDRNGVSLAQVAKFLNVSGVKSPYVQNVPYFYQYSNTMNPDGSCQNTSLAMALRYYGAPVTPDQLSGRYGVGAAAAGGLTTIRDNFNSEAARFGLRVRDRTYADGSVAQLRQLAASGKPVIVLGYFTNFGHVVVVIGYDGTNYYVHDPAGAWNQQLSPYASHGGHTPTNGIAVRYGKAVFEAAATGSDGYIWLHEFYPI